MASRTQSKYNHHISITLSEEEKALSIPFRRVPFQWETSTALPTTADAKQALFQQVSALIAVLSQGTDGEHPRFLVDPTIKPVDTPQCSGWVADSILGLSQPLYDNLIEVAKGMVYTNADHSLFRFKLAFEDRRHEVSITDIPCQWSISVFKQILSARGVVFHSTLHTPDTDFTLCRHSPSPTYTVKATVSFQSAHIKQTVTAFNAHLDGYNYAIRFRYLMKSYQPISIPSRKSSTYADVLGRRGQPPPPPARSTRPPSPEINKIQAQSPKADANTSASPTAMQQVAQLLQVEPPRTVELHKAPAISTPNPFASLQLCDGVACADLGTDATIDAETGDQKQLAPKPAPSTLDGSGHDDAPAGEDPKTPTHAKSPLSPTDTPFMSPLTSTPPGSASAVPDAGPPVSPNTVCALPPRGSQRVNDLSASPGGVPYSDTAADQTGKKQRRRPPPPPPPTNRMTRAETRKIKNA